LEFVARAVEAEDEGLFGWEDWVAGFFFFFFFLCCFLLVVLVSEVGLCAVVATRAAAVVAFFPLRAAGAVWSAVAIVVIVAVGVVWHSRSVYSWTRLRTSSRIRGFVAID
jgi:hypothetical protein